MSMTLSSLAPARLPEEAEAYRAEIRQFLSAERAAGTMPLPTRLGMPYSAEFSRKVGARGWIGLTWPRQYGGGGRTALERYVLTEELLAASAPVGCHWVADRQSGPILLRFGSEEQRMRFLPQIARGELYFCIGMSEPSSGSDLASLRARAERTEGGWLLNGQKLWTTSAHRAHYMITLARTSKEEQRHAGLSQFMIDLKATGVTVRPVRNMTGEADFNEVFFENVFLPDDALIGEPGNGWSQVSAELAYERSGPERWLSSFALLTALIEVAGASMAERIGRLLSHLVTLRQMSISVAASLQRGETPHLQAALVKDLGTRFEQDVVRTVRDIMLCETVGYRDSPRLAGLLTSAQLWAPAFTIRGGTSEILRGVIARGLELR